MNRFLRSGMGLLIAMMLIAASVTTVTAQTASAQDPLVQVLVQKGVLTNEDAKSISGTPGEQRDRLVQLLKQKGVITDADVATVSTPPSTGNFSMQPVRLAPGNSAAAVVPAVYNPQAKTEAKEAPKPAAPSFIPAVAPIRVLQLEPSKPGGLIPDIKLGSGAKLKLYGFFKTSVVYDSSSPYGNDFPLPGFLAVDTGLSGMDIGPNLSPEFHLKARAARIGGNFEWPDISPHVAVTGKFEADFEGNFTRVSNRNISSIRSSMPSLRLAWGRIDWRPTDTTGYYLLAGQDWTPFGSSILPNMLETTGFAIGFGNLYERAPQMRVGMSHTFSGDRKPTFAPDFAIALPGWGNTPPFIGTQNVTVATTGTKTTIFTGPGSLGDQLAYGERQGPDSSKPEVQGRLVFQFQADKAKGVAPAQIVVAGMHANRQDIIPLSNIKNFAPTALVNTFVAAFPRGTTVDGDRWGLQGGFAIPTRWVTIQASYYRGTGLRWYFASQLYQAFNNTTGLTSTFAVPSIDASGTAPVIGLNAVGRAVVAPQLEPRAQGGFIELGFPLSRIMNAEPTGRNAGWTLNLHYGYDGVFARDVRRAAPAGGRGIGDVALANINWKFNQFVTFALEESYYRTRAIHGNDAPFFPTISGLPSHQWHDVRTEFSTIFTF